MEKKKLKYFKKLYFSFLNNIEAQIEDFIVENEDFFYNNDELSDEFQQCDSCRINDLKGGFEQCIKNYEYFLKNEQE